MDSQTFNNWLITSEHIFKWLGIAWLIYIVFLSIWIVLKKRQPISTITWILTLAFFPYLGFLIYYFFGPQKIRRHQLQRLLSKSALKEHTDYLQSRNYLLSKKNYSPSWQQLSTLIRNTTGFPLTTARTIELLVDGKDTYASIYEAIENATDHIHLEYYIFEPDVTGTAFRNLLIKKAKEGLNVRLLVDDMGSAHLRPSFYQPMIDAGIKFALFHRPQISHIFNPRTNLRNHRKIVICDGLVAFTGGLNITDDENNLINKNAYHDVHIRVTGNAVHWLQLIFLEDWTYSTSSSELPNMKDLFPIQRPGNCALQIIPSGPDNDWEILHRTYLTIIQNARERIWLTTPYFVPSEATMLALSTASLKGVDVRLLVPKMSDSHFVSAASRSYFDELISSGVKIWEYNEKMLHSKTVVVDHSHSMIGSANFDSRSFRLNFEVTLLFFGPYCANRLAQQFEIDLKNASRVPLNRKGSFINQLFEATARLFSPIL